MIGKISFGRLFLFFLITAALFGAFSLLNSLNSFFSFYKIVASLSIMVSGVCFVVWLAITLFRPGQLLKLQRPGDGIISGFFAGIPYIRIAIISLVIAFVLSWVHSLVFPIGITAFLISVDMAIAGLLFQ